MEYQIKYVQNAIGRGTLSADEQMLRLRGYTVARQRRWMGDIFYLILCMMFFTFVREDVHRHVETFLGVPHTVWTYWLVVTALCIVMIAVGLLLVHHWPVSTSFEEFDKNLVTQTERLVGGEIRFNIPNPVKPGKLLKIRFKARNKAEAEQIEQALRISEV